MSAEFDLLACQVLDECRDGRLMCLRAWWTHIAPGASRATLYLQYYAYKIQRLENMKMVLRPADGQWYEFHLLQLQAFWDNATPWSMPS